MAGTANAPFELPVSAVNDMLDEASRGHRGAPSATAAELKSIFRDNQITSKLTMLDTEGEGVALIAQTRNGWLVRIPLTEAECLDMARTLLAKVRAI